MIKAFRSGDELVNNIKSASTTATSLHVWWLGQSGFLVKHIDRYVLFDPYLSDSLTKKYAATDKPHVRMTELVIDPARLDFIHLVTSSHNHTDHLDADTLLPLMQANPNLPVLVPAANQAFAAERLGVKPDRLHVISEDRPIKIDEFLIHAIPAAHETVERDDAGCCRFIGLVVEFGGFTIYHSGDTILYEGMIDRLKNWEIDLALLPINGRAPERRVAGNLCGREAAGLAKEIRARMVVPCHYDMFEFNTEPPDEFIARCVELEQPYTVLQNGEYLTLTR